MFQFLSNPVAINHLTLLLVILAFVVAGTGVYQAYQITRSSEAQLRAYVTIHTGSIRITDDEAAVAAHIEFQNTGQTPGYEFTIWSKILIGAASETPFDFELPVDQRASKSMIGPNTRANAGALVAVSTEEMQSIQNGALMIFVWGGADYRDAFGNARYFLFRCAVAGQPQTAMVEGKSVRVWPLRPHRSGYRAN